MILTLVLIALFFVAYFLNKYDDNMFWPELAMVLSAILLFLNFIIWPIIYYESLANIDAVNAMQITIDTQRENSLTEYERATMTGSVIEMNKDIARRKRMNKVLVFDSYIPDEIETVDYIK